MQFLQIILFTLVAAVLYVGADRLLLWIEDKRGEPLPNRSLVYFIIILVLALGSFELIQIIGQIGVTKQE